MELATAHHGERRLDLNSTGWNNMDHSRVDEQLGDLLRQCGAVTDGHIRVISADSNPQTDLDTRMNSYLKSRLTAIVEAPIVSEEDHVPAVRENGYCWVLDPIDGTINAIAGTDDFAVSIALVSVPDLQPVVGAVYLPRSGLLYQAVRDQGVRRNDTPLPMLPAEAWPRSAPIVSFGVPRDIRGIATRMAAALHGILAAGWVTRQSGAATVDICRVAAGSWSAFFEYRLMFWDFVAAALVAREAGCHAVAVPSDPPSGESFPLEYDLVVARNPAILSEVVEVIGIDPRAGVALG